MKDDAVYVFTRDRPDVLCTSLGKIADLEARKYIIDDSCEKINQLANAQLTSECAGILYIGNVEYKNFRLSLNIEESSFDILLRPLGQKEWNLGYARNLALLLAKVNSVERALFLDDDIKVPNTQMIMDTFNALDKYDFVGAPIEGMPDDSIVGHIANELGVVCTNERMLSGGFLAFKPSNITVPFANVYNEDWIWQLLQPTARRHEGNSCVFHRFSDPYKNVARRIKFQERGEIIITGLIECLEYNYAEFLSSSVFWKKVLETRREFLDNVRLAAQTQDRQDYVDIIASLLNGYDGYESRNFAAFFRQYKSSIEVFKDVKYATYK